MTCKNCGQTNPENTTFCINCGVKLTPAAAPAQPTAAPVQQPVRQPAQQPVTPSAPSVPTVPFENKPLSPWAYFGYQILFSIPLLGFVMLIVLSTKAARNVNLRNFARSYWCAVLIGIILGVVIVILGLVLSLAFGFTVESLISNVYPN